MKKFLISFIFVAVFGTYAWYSYSTNAASAGQQISAAPMPVTAAATGSEQPAAPTVSGSVSPTNTTSTPAPASAPAAPAATPTPVVVPVKKSSTGQYVDGSYTGAAADAYYGNIQVKVTISGGKLTNVVFLQSPSDRSTSRMINQQAMPVLKAEAIQAQSANVDGVSGASDSSMAFEQSLASALAQAKA